MLEALEKSLCIPSPLHRVDLLSAKTNDIDLWIKRDDLIDPLICGNKWRKIKYNLQKCLEGNHESIITFGGLFSNHLVAVAAAGARCGLPTVGIIRSYQKSLNNPTLDLLKEHGMDLYFVEPKEYNKKDQSSFIKAVINEYDSPFLLEEGGTNSSCVQGVIEMMNEVENTGQNFSHIALTLGTAGTLAGVSRALQNTDTKIIAISPFKGQIDSLAGFGLIDSACFQKIDIVSCYPSLKFGAYDPMIVEYIHSFKAQYDIALDPIYTVKLFMTLEHLIYQDYFPKNSKVLAIHTGGLQGIKGYEYLNNCQLAK